MGRVWVAGGPGLDFETWDSQFQEDEPGFQGVPGATVVEIASAWTCKVGDHLEDISVMAKVSFVMKSGVVYKRDGKEVLH